MDYLKTMVTILIVEDEESISNLWVEFLSTISDDLRLAKNIPDALEHMRKIPHPALVLLDLGLPGSESHENTLSYIKEFKAINPASVVIVITGAIKDFLNEKAIQHGADDFAHKMDVTSQKALLGLVKRSLENRNPKKPAFEQSSDILSKLTDLLIL